MTVQMAVFSGIASRYHGKTGFGREPALKRRLRRPIQADGLAFRSARENTMRLLLVEDDRMIGESVQKGLHQDGFAVDWVCDGQAAEHALSNDVYDLVVLDLGLPRKSGLDVLTALRAGGNAVPVLILTARDAITDRVKGLDGGADDYVVKPWLISGFEELL